MSQVSSSNIKAASVGDGLFVEKGNNTLGSKTGCECLVGERSLALQVERQSMNPHTLHEGKISEMQARNVCLGKSA